MYNCTNKIAYEIKKRGTLKCFIESTIVQLKCFTNQVKDFTDTYVDLLISESELINSKRSRGRLGTYPIHVNLKNIRLLYILALYIGTLKFHCSLVK